MQLHVYNAQFGSVRASDYCRSQELSYVLDLKQEEAGVPGEPGRPSAGRITNDETEGRAWQGKTNRNKRFYTFCASVKLREVFWCQR